MVIITGGQKRKIDFMAFKTTTWWSFFTVFKLKANVNKKLLANSSYFSLKKSRFLLS